MKKTGEESAVLHDAYFNRPPRLIGLFLIRLALLCSLSGCAVWSLTDLYLLTDHQLALSLAAAGFSAVFFTLASLFPARFVYLGAAAVGGVAAYLLRSPLLRLLSFFADRVLLRLDSRLISTRSMLFHSYDRLVTGYYDSSMDLGWIVGMLLVGALIAFLFTVCARTRFRPLAVAAIYGGLSAAAFTAEISGFHPSMIAFLTVYAALYTVDTGYELDGRLVFGKPRAAREALRRNERSYRKRTRLFILGRKLGSDLPRYFKYNANSFVALLITAAILVAAAAIIPEGQGFNYEAFFNSVRDAGVTVADSVGGALGVSFGSVNDNGYFSYSGYGDRSGGIGISEPADGDLPVLDVILDRNDTPVYLRGDIGVSYTGGAWTAIRDEYGRFIDENGNRYSDLLADFYPDLQYQVLRQRLSSLGYNPDRLFPLQKVSITYRRNTKVVFQPVAAYELNFRDNDYFETFGDYILRARSGKGYLKTFECLSLTPFMANSYMSEAITLAKQSGDLAWTLPDGMTNAEYDQKIAAYRGLIDRAYMPSDPSIFPFVEEMYNAGVIGGLSEFDTATAVCRYFKDHFTYSLTTDNGAAAESLSNFLYETREGHCALFATAMVLAMRELGIPARYVTGYAASGAGEPTDDGRYRYTLREGDLHAWVEVYFDNAGWLPFDPTAAVSGFGGTTAEAPPPDESAVTEEGQTFPEEGEVSDDDANADPPPGVEAEYGDESGDPAGT
ncbi:MAG: transglutaminase-like domain-containing protein, partial [Eubacterium sp.]|nr:transglutaminase-like domain-containing protein [Eubacterium sp.]MCM1418044.1 transglutaminase-like domain-containing protein [Roseburia sp.]